jgi:hypothetical protein
MPLNTEIIRGGRRLKLRWGGFHITAMVYAIAFERKLAVPNEGLDYPNEPQGISPGNAFQAMDYGVISNVCPSGDFTLKQEHKFQDTMDGEIFQLKPGDKLSFWRSSKS